MIALLRFEIAKLVRRRRTWAMLAVVNLIPLLGTVLLAAATLFPLGNREKLLIPGLTGFFSLGVYYQVYALPLALSILSASLLAGEEGQGCLRTLLLTFRSRRAIVMAKLLALATFAMAAYAMVALLFPIALGCVWLKMSPTWWRAFDYPVTEVVVAYLSWVPWALAAQLALVGFLALVNSLCRSTYGAVGLALVLLGAAGILTIVLPQTAAMAGRPMALERGLFPYHYSVVYDINMVQNIFFFGRIDLPRRWAERTGLLLAQGLLCLGLALWIYQRRDVIT